ncbi:hypothetical protein [Ensifer sp. MJa1]|uniref:hypothetical protein n=1 Tax=Ensifer sp. MJa1 TaxID=2919888 RepID=UPI00300BB2AC
MDTANYQGRVADAHHALFHDDPTDVAERLARFMEEANETCQALGMTREDAHRLVDYTYDRPAGEPAKEIGSAMLTLTSLCVVAGYDLMSCAEADLEKLQRPETIDRIRVKRSTRHGRGPLPGFDPSSPGKDGGQEPMGTGVFANGEMVGFIGLGAEAARDVLAERERQMAVEGWSIGHDDAYLDGELAEAAAAYALGSYRLAVSARVKGQPHDTTHYRTIWPWSLEWWKPTERRRDLVKAGALIIAEIERIDRIQAALTKSEAYRAAKIEKSNTGASDE